MAIFKLARRATFPTLVAASALAALPAQALTWTFTGPETATISEIGDTTSFNYDINQNYGSGTPYPYYSVVRWTATATAERTGEYVFDWNINGFHSWFQAEMELTTFGGTAPLTLASGPASGGFNVLGEDLVFDVVAGENFGFTIGGSHFDGTRAIRGTLNVTEVAPVPLPATAMMLLAGVGALGFARRRKS
jgi:hypothetical protein